MIHIQSSDIVGLQVAETGTSNAAGGTNYQSTLASPCTSEDCGDAAKDTDHSSQKELPSDSSFQYESKAEAMSDTIQPQHQSILSTKESKSMLNVNTTTTQEKLKIHFSETRSFNKPREVDSRKEVSEVDSVKPQQELRSTRSRSEAMPPKKVHLSNRERLLLRKQALKMKPTSACCW
nr:uncharacterized protein LOC108947414 [Nicotiana tomentosiformis]